MGRAFCSSALVGDIFQQNPSVFNAERRGASFGVPLCISKRRMMLPEPTDAILHPASF
jgi:hypothetical protein